jgi:hypothetical protein
MKPATYTKLLKDLQKLEKRLAAAYTADVRAHPERMAQVTERWHAAEVGGRVDDFLDVCARRSAVQFLLRTVYVRVLEDLGALNPPRIRGQWGLAAFKDLAPALGLRGYLSWVFRDLAKDFPALFTPGPDELPLPAEDLVREVWELWHAEDGKGGLTYGWQAAEGEPADFDSRFLGDLYQDLDAEVRKRFALLQTPVFVEEYILDHTLTPALAEFDPATLRAKGETFRLIDPTCGSGHFLIGAFHRLATWWEATGVDKWEAARRALESVWGADLNPHAVDIARFRLLLEVRARTGVTDLERLAELPLNLAVMDTLIPWERLAKAPELFPERDRLSKYATAEERKANARFLARDFHVVVGNPPYITPKDKGKDEDYRWFWADACYMRYSLSAPFAWRFFGLACTGGFVGQITANSFMKREFGKPLVQELLAKIDLSGVVDSSGAYIPGHGTPTVILFGRNRVPVGRTVHCVLGKRGEPERPAEPSKGVVWTEIVTASGAAFEGMYVSGVDVDRSRLAVHPWALTGGEAPAISAAIDEGSTHLLSGLEARTGLKTYMQQDDVFFGAPPSVIRDSRVNHVEVVEGFSSRDYAIQGAKRAIFPYRNDDASQVLELTPGQSAWGHFWRFRTLLMNRTSSGFRTIADRGLKFYEYGFHHPVTHRGPVITFAFVATHNHFVLDRGGRVFKQTSPVVKLPDTATEDDHLDLLGLLNSSTLGFWMKQIFHDKGGGGIGGGLATEDWEHFFEYDATKLKLAPLNKQDRARRVALARALDATAQERAGCLPDAVLTGSWRADELTGRLSDTRARYATLTHRMVALQEELDWLTYQSYGLLEDLEVVGPEAVEPLSPGHRPFEILAAQADAEAPPDEKSAWWTRHGHPKVTEIPTHYSRAHQARLRARMETIEGDDKLQLLESFPFKRRWLLPNLDEEVKKAARGWLLDRLEDLFAEGGPLSTPRPYRLEEIVAAWTKDPRIAAAAAVAEERADVDLTLVAEGLLSSESMPDNPRRVYTPSGLRKLDQWKEVWALQDREDAGEKVGDIQKPPELAAEDFVKGEYYSVRGKLNVPRERFLAFADLAPVRYGWNGWRDLERGLAQVEAFTEAEGDPHNPLPAPTHADPRRCGVTLGLWESLDDVRRWSGADHHGELKALAQEACRQESCPCDLVKRWQAWVNREFEVTTGPTVEVLEASVEDRAALSRVLASFGTQGAPAREVVRASGWSLQRVQLVLDDLVASGDVATSGRGVRTMYALPQPKLF